MNPIGCRSTRMPIDTWDPRQYDKFHLCPPPLPLRLP
jgi:hypothetical protein